MDIAFERRDHIIRSVAWYDRQIDGLAIVALFELTVVNIMNVATSPPAGYTGTLEGAVTTAVVADREGVIETSVGLNGSIELELVVVYYGGCAACDVGEDSVIEGHVGATGACGE